MNTERSYKGHIIMLVVNIIFGLNTPITKSLMPEFLTAYSLIFLRFAGSSLLFWIISYWVKEEKVTSRELGLLFFAGMLGIAVNQLAFVKGLSITTPINAAIIVTLTPIMTMILASIYQKEPITAKKTTGVIIGAGGALLLILSGSAVTNGNASTLGNLLCLLASFAYALYLTIFKKLINKHSPVTLMKWMFLFSSIVTLPLCLPDAVRIPWQEISLNGYLRIGYIVILATFATYMLIPIGQKLMRPTTLSMYNYVQPLVAAIVAVIMGIDRFGLNTLLAGILVFVGVYVVTQSKSRAQLEREKAATNIKTTRETD
jgi:drug/metabolite transporter (DMT)-like permease